MDHAKGLIVSEIITAIIAVVVIAAIVFGLYVSSQRDDRVEAAQATMQAIKEKAESLVDAGAPIPCNDDFVSAETLANDYLNIMIIPATIDPINGSEGYGVGIHIKTNKITDNGDTFVTAERLYKMLFKESKESLRQVNTEDDDLEYSLLLSESPLCSV